MNKTILLVALLSIQSLALSTPPSRGDLNGTADQALRFAGEQLKETVARNPDPEFLVRSTMPDGSWNKIKPSDWTSGFFPGLLWLLSEHSGDKEFRKWAEERTASLEGQKNNTNDHDVGFRMMSSFGNGYRITKNPAYREVLLTSAKSLASRFNPTVGCIRSWNHGNWTFPVIIDNMMNLELLFWASKNGGDRSLYDIAVKHALTTMKNHVRPDGGTFHVVDYNKETGEVLKRQTHQGYRDDSTWSRGHAWGIYGFTMAYRETADRRFLATAMKLANYFLGHLPEDHIPYWDFQAPNIPNEPRDSSAAAIASSGLLELSSLLQGAEEAKKYHEAAISMLESLCSPRYLSRGTKLSSILQHATGSKAQESEVDVGLIYGDYYFVEALMRYKDPQRIPRPTPELTKP